MLVTGGPTSAGTKRVKTLPMWKCMCPVLSPVGTTTRKSHDFNQPGGQRYYVQRVQLGTTYSCPDCGERRPDAS